MTSRPASGGTGLRLSSEQGKLPPFRQRALDGRAGRAHTVSRAPPPGRRLGYYTHPGVPNRSNAQAQEEKRRLLLDAAVRVFARKGYHASRGGDIAEEAGGAPGPLHHSFAWKEHVVRGVFREPWRALMETIESVEGAGDPP